MYCIAACVWQTDCWLWEKTEWSLLCKCDCQFQANISLWKASCVHCAGHEGGLQGEVTATLLNGEPQCPSEVSCGRCTVNQLLCTVCTKCCCPVFWWVHLSTRAGEAILELLLWLQENRTPNEVTFKQVTMSPCSHFGQNALYTGPL